MNAATVGSNSSILPQLLAKMSCINATTNARLNGLESPNCLADHPTDVFTPSAGGSQGSVGEFPTFQQLNNARNGGK